MFYYHPRDDKSGDIWNHLTSIKDLHIIHLKRRNVFRTIISRKIAGSNDKWVAWSSEKSVSKENKAITFTTEELKQLFEQTRVWEESGDEIFKSHALESVYYEDLIENPKETFSKIMFFLGLQYVQPQTSLVRQNPGKMRNLVINYDDLKSAFSGTEQQLFFEE